MNFNFSMQGREWNEDRCFSCEDFVFLIDGATSLSELKYSTMNSDAEWYADWWYRYLKVELKEKDKKIYDILSDGIDKIVAEFRELAGDNIIEDFPSCTLSVARKLDNKQIEIYIIGDSPVLLQSDTGRTIKISDTLNNINDDINISIMEYYSKKDKISIADARKKYKQFFMNSRLSKNKLWGFNILADSKDAVFRGIYKIVDCEFFKKIILMSDGFSQIFDLFNLYSIEEIANILDSKENAERLYKELYYAQEIDKNLDKHIRMKLRDDASVSVLSWEDKS